jgi:hypothetical protein
VMSSAAAGSAMKASNHPNRIDPSWVSAPLA